MRPMNTFFESVASASGGRWVNILQCLLHCVHLSIESHTGCARLWESQHHLQCSLSKRALQRNQIFVRHQVRQRQWQSSVGCKSEMAQIYSMLTAVSTTVCCLNNICNAFRMHKTLCCSVGEQFLKHCSLPSLQMLTLANPKPDHTHQKGFDNVDVER